MGKVVAVKDLDWVGMMIDWGIADDTGAVVVVQRLVACPKHQLLH